MSSLTKYQRRLVKELYQIYDLVALDFYDVKSYDRKQRTTRLQMMKRAVARAEIVTVYTLVDEYLACELCIHFFGIEKDFPALWKTRKFKLFNYHFLEELSLLPKLRYVKAIRKIPRAIAADIERLNALRNGVAHAFFPENLKRSRPEWRGISIFSLEGLEAFKKDMNEVIDYFARIRIGRY